MALATRKKRKEEVRPPANVATLQNRMPAPLAAESVSKEAKGDAADGENHEEKGLQRTQLRVRNMKMIAQQRNQRHEDLPRGEVDKIDQSKYSKETNLVGSERNGLSRHAERAR